MSIYLAPTREWMVEDQLNVEYKVSGELREDILKRALRPINDITSVWMVKSTRSDGHVIEIFVHPFGEPKVSVFSQNEPFEDPKDAQQNLFEWIFENLAKETGT
jgi:plasmid replication initiation protein